MCHYEKEVLVDFSFNLAQNNNHEWKQGTTARTKSRLNYQFTILFIYIFFCLFNTGMMTSLSF